jgi:hypothetical protein
LIPPALKGRHLPAALVALLRQHPLRPHTSPSGPPSGARHSTPKLPPLPAELRAKVKG